MDKPSHIQLPLTCGETPLTGLYDAGGLMIAHEISQQEAQWVKQCVNLHAELVAALERLVDNFYDTSRDFEALEMARAALAKATGQA